MAKKKKSEKASLTQQIDNIQQFNEDSHKSTTVETPKTEDKTETTSTEKSTESKAEDILFEWIKTNDINNLEVIAKVGSIDNSLPQKNNLAPATSNSLIYCLPGLKQTVQHDIKLFRLEIAQLYGTGRAFRSTNTTSHALGRGDLRFMVMVHKRRPVRTCLNTGHA